ncbi:MAG: isopentenyl-diphosphate Delta-isomerase [Gammaproteobacteria bacterium]
MTATEYVVLVDLEDREIGLAEKLAAHEQNLLHRAFSVFIFREKSNTLELLLQQRALSKYHSPGLWTNTCCSHPRQDEDIILAGKRRLLEEMGISTELEHLGRFHYNAHFPNGLAENEMDHVLLGFIPAEIAFTINPEEVHTSRWVTIPALEEELAANAEQFTPWLKLALDIVKTKIS